MGIEVSLYHHHGLTSSISCHITTNSIHPSPNLSTSTSTTNKTFSHSMPLCPPKLSPNPTASFLQYSPFSRPRPFPPRSHNLLHQLPLNLLPTSLPPRQHHNPLRPPTNRLDSRTHGKIQPHPPPRHRHPPPLPRPHRLRQIPKRSRHGNPQPIRHHSRQRNLRTRRRPLYPGIRRLQSQLRCRRRRIRHQPTRANDHAQRNRQIDTRPCPARARRSQHEHHRSNQRSRARLGRCMPTVRNPGYPRTRGRRRSHAQTSNSRTK